MAVNPLTSISRCEHGLTTWAEVAATLKLLLTATVDNQNGLSETGILGVGFVTSLEV